jgi:hypothetical protein
VLTWNKVGMDWLIKIGSIGKLLPHSNKPFVLIKGTELLGQLSNCQFIKTDSAPWSE